MREIFQFLPGCELIHHIALLNQRIRKEILPIRGHLEKARVFTVKSPAGKDTTVFAAQTDEDSDFDMNNLHYMMQICSTIHLVVTKRTEAFYKQLILAIEYTNTLICKFNPN